ncbi:MAG: metal ABC transporter substrate-binding protein [Verrucomicrobiota bacterium]|nr:metal ABC transporter substrate-binding protein [Verrucomicrobiota bacterium]
MRFLFAALLFFLVCDSAAEQKKLKIVTTILPAYCFAANVGGDLVEVVNLLPPNVGPHDYQLSPRDLRSLKNADLIVLNGLGLDDWVKKPIRSEGKLSRLVELSTGLDQELLRETTHLDLGHEAEHDHEHAHQHHTGGNPHIWLDPQLAMHSVTNILQALETLAPQHREIFRRNASDYIEKLRTLDSDLTTQLAPVASIPFITYHDAFPYFIRRYNLKLAGILEAVPDVSPSPRYLADLLRVVREKNVKVIYTEPQFSTKLARQIARDLKISIAQLDPLESGKLDPASYERGMRKNAEVLLKTLR